MPDSDPKRPSLSHRFQWVIRNEHARLYLLAALVGIATSYGTIGFREVIGLVQFVAFGSGSEELFASIVAATPWWQVLLAPTLGGLVIGLFIYFFMPERRNHGVPDAIEACALRGGRMDVKAGIGAAVAAAASIGAGASVGREGPAVHIGASIGAWVAERLGFSRAISLTLLGCGVAAAVAASFNAPIAGVFFAIEVVIGNYALNVFGPIVIASVASAVVVRNHYGDFPAFFVPDYFIESFFEIPAFLVLGLVCAAIAAVFMYGIVHTQNLVAKVPIPAWLRPALGGLAVGVIAIAFPHVLGVGYQTMALALKGALPLLFLAALVIAKIAATSIALGCGFAGGVFSPSLFIGAMVGGSFGVAAASVFPELASSHGAYTVIGMAGVASAVLGAPISTMLIVFELTNHSHLTIAVMVTAALSSLVARRLVGHPSFFHWQLECRGVDVGVAGVQGQLLAIGIGDVVSSNFAVIPTSMTVAEIRSLVARQRPGVLFVHDDRDRLCGHFTSTRFVERSLGVDEDRTTAEDIAERSETVILAHASLGRALKLMRTQDEEFLPVVDDIQRCRVVGVVYHKDLILAHNRVLLDAGVKPQ